jgi:hypothetical protein
MFASASLDGVIVVWQMESLTPLKRLSYPDKFVSIDQNRKFYAHAVNHLLVLNQTYLAACIGNGFQIFNINTGESVMQKSDAHESTVYCIISVSGGKRFLTCSADAQIKFWGNSNDFSFSEDSDNLRHSKRKGSHNIQVVSLGEMWGHTDQVKTLLKLSETAFVSGGHDNLIILWRDGEEQSLIRNKCAAEAIRELQSTLFTSQSNSRPDIHNHRRVSSLSFPNCNRTPPRAITSDDSQGSGIWNQDTEGERDETESEEQEPVVPISYLEEETKKIESSLKKDSISISPRAVDAKYQTYNMISPRTIDFKYQTQNQFTSERDLKYHSMKLPSKTMISAPIALIRSQELPKNQDKIDPIGPFTPRVVHLNEKTGKKVKIPNYLFDKAENLMKENKLSLEEIREKLIKEGHGSVIVEAVINELEKITITEAMN